MIEKLKVIKEKFDKLTQDISNPDIIADMKLWQAKVKEHAGLQELMEEYERYLKLERDYIDAQELLEMEVITLFLMLLFQNKHKVKVWEGF